jgi:hypothetical protein
MKPNSQSTKYWGIRLRKKINKKATQNKRNNNEKNESQIWYKIKMKPNIKECNWKKKQLRKCFKIKEIAINIIKIKFNI